MVNTTTTPFDPAAYIGDAEDATIYLNDALESRDPAVIAAAIGTIARARGASALASVTGLSRASLYSSLGPDGNPTLRTVLAVLDALGIDLRAQARAA